MLKVECSGWQGWGFFWRKKGLRTERVVMFLAIRYMGSWDAVKGGKMVECVS